MQKKNVGKLDWAAIRPLYLGAFEVKISWGLQWCLQMFANALYAPGEKHAA